MKRKISYFLAVALAIAVYFGYDRWQSSEEDKAPAVTIDASGFENGIHVASGLKQGEGLELVLQNCTNCHSARLIIQNRASAEGWKNMIEWMQETQNLWDLGENETAIINYLSENYAPEYKGRRKPLDSIQWYLLKQ